MTHQTKIRALALALLFVVGGSASAMAADTTTRGITVQGSGTVKMVPDAVRISVTTNVVASTTKDALGQSSGVAAAIRKVLTANAIASKEYSSPPMVCFTLTP